MGNTINHCVSCHEVRRRREIASIKGHNLFFLVSVILTFHQIHDVRGMNTMWTRPARCPTTLVMAIQ